MKSALRSLLSVKPILRTAQTFLALTILGWGIHSPAQTNASFQIAGTITLPDDGCNQAIVVLCDRSSGEPLCRQNAQPFMSCFTNQQIAMDWLTVIPDALGHFQFTNLPAGNYIAVAQAWNSPLPRTNLINNSREFQIAARDFRVETIHLLGREEITVPSDIARHVKLTPPGTNSIRVAYQHDGEFLMLGTQPQRGDPVLQWLGWGTNFIRHLIGFGDIPRGGMLVHGLPLEAYASIFSNDNSPGFGSTRLNVSDTNAVKMPIVAGWSDGHKTPPTNLVWLVEVLATNRFDIDALLDIPGKPRLFAYVYYTDEFTKRERAKARLIPPIWDKEIVLPTGQKTRVVDLLTALSYARLSGKIKY